MELGELLSTIDQASEKLRQYRQEIMATRRYPRNFELDVSVDTALRKLVKETAYLIGAAGQRCKRCGGSGIEPSNIE